MWIFSKLKIWFRNSLTIAWARLLQLAGVAFEFAAQAADLLQAVNAQVLPIVPPKWVGLYTLGIGLVTELARRRSLKREG
jgi:hypothetical protein